VPNKGTRNGRGKMNRLNKFFIKQLNSCYNLIEIPNPDEEVYSGTANTGSIFPPDYIPIFFMIIIYHFLIVITED